MLVSKFAEIDRLMMAQVRGNRPVVAEKMVVVDGMIIVRLPKERWWCSWEDFSKWCRMPGEYRGQVARLLRGLVLLGLVPKTVADEHMAWVKELTAAKDRKYAQETLERISKEYGVAVPNLLNQKRKAG